MKMEILGAQRVILPRYICYHFSTFLLLSEFSRAGVYSSLAIRNCPQFISPTSVAAVAANLPCTTKWVPPAEKAAVCLPVTTRVALISLAYIRLDPRPFPAAFRKMQILSSSSLVEMVPYENIATDIFKPEHILIA